MPSEPEFQAVIDELATFARDVGSTVIVESEDPIIEYEDESSETYDFAGHVFEEDDHRYVVAGHPDFKFLGIVSFVHIHNHISSNLDDEYLDAVAEMIQDEAGEDGVGHGEAAAFLLRKMPDDDQDALESYIYHMISGPEHKTDIEYIDDDNSSGLRTITTEGRIYPYENDFSIRHFHESKQSVLSASTSASRLVARSFSVNGSSDNPSEIQLEPRFSW